MVSARTQQRPVTSFRRIHFRVEVCARRWLDTVLARICNVYESRAQSLV